MLAESGHTSLLEQVLAAFESLGYPREVVTQWSIPAPDAADLAAHLARELASAPAPRVLEVGTFVGTSALFMLLADPRSEVHTIDPNFPLEVEFDAMDCGHRNADLAKRTQDVAALAADRLGIRARLHLHAGGFSSEATFAGIDAVVPAIGSDVIRAHGPFDAVFVDGLHFEDVVLSDLRLAATAVRDGAPILMHDAIGYWGSCVRRAVGRFLEQHPHFSFSHAPYADLYRSVARLSTKPIDAPAPAVRAELCFGAHLAKHAEYAGRAITTTFPALDAHACDALSAPLAARIGCDINDKSDKSGKHAPRCAVALATFDELAPDVANAELARIAGEGSTRNDILILGFTPPGEQGAAGPWSRPLASRIAALDAIGFDAYDIIVPFLEPFSYALGSGCVLPVRTTFLSTTVVAVRRGSAASARCAALERIDAASARRIDDVRTQRAHEHAMLASVDARRIHLESKFAVLAAEHEAMRVKHASHDAAVAGLQSRVDELTRRLQHMLDWRVHIGRHHFWRRPNAKV